MPLRERAGVKVLLVGVVYQTENPERDRLVKLPGSRIKLAVSRAAWSAALAPAVSAIDAGTVPAAP